MVKRNISFYEREKKINFGFELCTKGKVHIMNFSDEQNVDIMDFRE